uniref:Uncharacterized protein n=1 Tax=Electrophorus electricus TaxID=8005 RepID=A0A4W4GSV0_ELEEL
MLGPSTAGQKAVLHKDSGLSEKVPAGVREGEGSLQECGQWASKAEFLLAVAGQIIGLGNVYSLFLIVFLVLFGIPLFLLETALGQHTSLGGVSARRSICPLFGGSTHMLALSPTCFPTHKLQKRVYDETCWTRTGINDKCVNRETLEQATVREVLNLSEVGDLGSINWRLAQLTHLKKSVTLPGAVEGIIYYLKPNHTRQADPQVWMDAGTRTFFSYGICLGSLTALGSYNKFNNDCYRYTLSRDSFFLCLLNSVTSFIAGFAIFSVLGFMTQEQDIDISKVAQSGPGLAFIVYPRAVSLMPPFQLWSVCFFLIIIMLGLDTHFVSLEALMTSLTDLYPTVIWRGCRRELLLLPGQPGHGLYVFQVCDHYVCSGAILLLLSIFQSVAIGWVYGTCHLFIHMIGYAPPCTFRLCWRYLTPAVCMDTFVFSLVSWSPLTLRKGVAAPAWTTALGWLLVLSSVSLLPLCAIYALVNAHGTFVQVGRTASPFIFSGLSGELF